MTIIDEPEEPGDAVGDAGARSGVVSWLRARPRRILAVVTGSAIVALAITVALTRPVLAPAEPWVCATDPDRLARQFLEVASDDDAARLARCWTDGLRAAGQLPAIVATGGASEVRILARSSSSDGRTVAVLAVPTWRRDAAPLWPTGRAKWVALERADEVWRVARVQTPLHAGAGSCDERALGPTEVVRIFFALVHEGQPAGMERCWASAAAFVAAQQSWPELRAPIGHLVITSLGEPAADEPLQLGVHWRVREREPVLTPQLCCFATTTLEQRDGRWAIRELRRVGP